MTKYIQQSVFVISWPNLSRAESAYPLCKLESSEQGDIQTPTSRLTDLPSGKANESTKKTHESR